MSILRAWVVAVAVLSAGSAMAVDVVFYPGEVGDSTVTREHYTAFWGRYYLDNTAYWGNEAYRDGAPTFTMNADDTKTMYLYENKAYAGSFTVISDGLDGNGLGKYTLAPNPNFVGVWNEDTQKLTVTLQTVKVNFDVSGYQSSWYIYSSNLQHWEGNQPIILPKVFSGVMFSAPNGNTSISRAAGGEYTIAGLPFTGGPISTAEDKLTLDKDGLVAISLRYDATDLGGWIKFSGPGMGGTGTELQFADAIKLDNQDNNKTYTVLPGYTYEIYSWLTGQGFTIENGTVEVPSTFEKAWEHTVTFVKGDERRNVTFSIAAVPVPEPATMSLLALGGLAMLRRRR